MVVGIATGRSLTIEGAWLGDVSPPDPSGPPSLIQTTGLIAFWDALGLPDGPVAQVLDLVETYDLTAVDPAPAAGGVIAFDGASDAYQSTAPNLYGAAALPNAATFAAEFSLPDALGGDAGQGYSIAGAAYDDADGKIWTINGGLNLDGSNDERIQSVVLLNPDYTKANEWRIDGVLPDLDLADNGDGESPQAIAVDNANGFIWVADPEAQQIRCFNKADMTSLPANDISRGYNIGSLSISEDGAHLWVMSRTPGNATIQKMPTAGGTPVRNFTVDLNSRHDHITERNGTLYITCGNNGGQASIVGMDPDTGEPLWAAPLPFPGGPNGMVGIEGIFWNPAKGRWVITHNGYFHYGDPLAPVAADQWPRTNILAEYDLDDPGAMRDFDVWFLGNPAPNGADATLEIGSVIDSPRQVGSFGLSFVNNTDRLRVWKTGNGSDIGQLLYDVDHSANTLYYLEVRGADVTLYQNEVLVGTQQFASNIDGGVALKVATLGSTLGGARELAMDFKSAGIIAGGAADRQITAAQILYRHGDEALLPAGHPYEGGAP